MASQMSDVSEKLRAAFKMYDEDGSGTIDKEEMVDIVTNLYAVQGVAKEMAVERADSVFGKLDVNGDGVLNEEEFVMGCMADERLASLLNTGSTQQTEEEEPDK